MANDSEHDFDLVQEAWIDGSMVAIVYRDGWEDEMKWCVSFYTPYSKANRVSYYKFSWEDFQRIAQSFTTFQEEIIRKEAANGTINEE